MGESDGLLNLLGATLIWTLLPLFAYVIVRRKQVPPTPPPRLRPPTERQSDGVRRVRRTAHEYNYSAARRDYLVRRYALRWVIIPFAVLSLALVLAYVMGA